VAKKKMSSLVRLRFFKVKGYKCYLTVEKTYKDKKIFFVRPKPFELLRISSSFNCVNKIKNTQIKLSLDQKIPIFSFKSDKVISLYLKNINLLYYPNQMTNDILI